MCLGYVSMGSLTRRGGLPTEIDIGGVVRAQDTTYTSNEPHCEDSAECYLLAL
jgi:hypothetical protein